MITYYDRDGDVWTVEGVPLTAEEEKEIGIICAISYSNKIENSVIKTRGVYENIAQNKYYVKIIRGILYDPTDDRYIVDTIVPKSQDSCVISSKKIVEKEQKPDPVGEGVMGCKSGKDTVKEIMKPSSDNFKKVNRDTFDYYTKFLSTSLKRYYHAASREL